MREIYSLIGIHGMVNLNQQIYDLKNSDKAIFLGSLERVSRDKIVSND